MAKLQYPSKSELLELFDYDNGNLIWKVNRGRNKVKGLIATNIINKCGYYRCTINNIKYYAHRIIWIMHYGDIPNNMFIDHINRNTTDNRIENFRLATSMENGMNSGKKSNNTTGYKGVRIHSQTGKYVSEIRYNGKKVYLGSFSNVEDADEAYKIAAKQYHKDFASV